MCRHTTTVAETSNTTVNTAGVILRPPIMVVLNPKMDSSKIEFWRENAELPNVKVSKHSIINV